ncbi:hypothetical protein E2562_033164 [Oryza meyeriana var. granulata]|uniref:Uncharacterized protein n=1 Tax=Oryza meyeriana var. granulata TaxID=110450 RepID=A0A6G1DRI6_9ORYZ|nr:hypothetical protein E2562_033164 [Oryza meyeriana var. granulata]
MVSSRKTSSSSAERRCPVQAAASSPIPRLQNPVALPLWSPERHLKRPFFTQGAPLKSTHYQSDNVRYKIGN